MMRCEINAHVFVNCLFYSNKEQLMMSGKASSTVAAFVKVKASSKVQKVKVFSPFWVIAS